MPKRLKQPQVGSGTTSPQQPSTNNEERFPLNTVDSIPSNTGENTMTVNFETLAKAEQTKSIADYERYQELLRDLAAGKGHDEAEILEILERVGRSVNMLKEDYEWRAKRDTMIAEVRNEADYRAEQDAVNAEWKTLGEEFAKIEAEYDQKRWVLNARENRAKAKLNEVSRFRDELKQSCRDPHLYDEIEKLDRQRQSFESKNYLAKQKEDARLKLVFKQQELDRMPAFCPGRIEKVDNLKAIIKELQVRYDELQLEIDNLDKQEREIEAAKREVYERMVFA